VEWRHEVARGHGVPLLGVWVVEVVAPEALLELVGRDAELLAEQGGEGGEREAPAVEARGKRHGAVLWAHGDVAHQTVLVDPDDVVHRRDRAAQTLVQLLGFLYGNAA
jgi:hypothetical protein